MHLVGEFRRQAALASAWFARDKYDLARTLFSLVSARLQLLKLRFSTDERLWLMRDERGRQR